MRLLFSCFFNDSSLTAVFFFFSSHCRTCYFPLEAPSSITLTTSNYTAHFAQVIPRHRRLCIPLTKVRIRLRLSLSPSLLLYDISSTLSFIRISLYICSVQCLVLFFPQLLSINLCLSFFYFLHLSIHHYLEDVS